MVLTDRNLSLPKMLTSNDKIAGDRGKSSPDVCHQETVADLPGKERQGNNGKWRKSKRRKIVKGNVEKGEKLTRNEDIFLCFSLTFVWSMKMEIFYQGKAF